MWVVLSLAAIILCCTEVKGGFMDKVEDMFEQVKDNVFCRVAEDTECGGIKFYFYTRNRINNPYQLYMNDQKSLSSTPVVDNKMVKVMVHGYMSNSTGGVFKNLASAYFARGDCNIISVDWSPLCRMGCYLQSAHNVPCVGYCVAKMLNQFLPLFRFSIVHLLGHSLGAHVCFWASKSLNCPNTYVRATAFDKAGPLFEGNSRLVQKSCANFTDEYRSNCRVFGSCSPIGADFVVYCNNAMFQPECYCDSVCAHGRGMVMYAQSMTKPMLVFSCKGGGELMTDECPMPKPSELVNAGENCDHKPGRYVLITKKENLLERSDYHNKTYFEECKKAAKEECYLLIGPLLRK